MIKFIVKFPIKQGMEEAYLQELKPCVIATRQEPDCLEYNAFWDSTNNVLTLFECYPNEDAVNAHIASEHFTNDFLALQKYYDGEVIVEKYTNPIV